MRRGERSAATQVDVRHAGSGGAMLQTAQRVGSAVGVALVLAQFFTRLASSRGDFPEALDVSLRTTIGFVVAALALGLFDLRTSRRAPSASPSSPRPA